MTSEMDGKVARLEHKIEELLLGQVHREQEGAKMMFELRNIKATKPTHVP